MPEATQPISLRLARRDIEQLKARAHTVSGTLTGVARALILSGLAGGDSKALAGRLMAVERRLAALESLARELSDSARNITAVTSDLRAKFDALLSALSSTEGAA
jgi:DNA repair ATPase RecN